MTRNELQSMAYKHNEIFNDSTNINEVWAKMKEAFPTVDDDIIYAMTWAVDAFVDMSDEKIMRGGINNG